jgi:hypothetical protein
MSRTSAENNGKRSKKPFVLGCLGGCLTLILVLVGFTLYWYSWIKSVPEDTPTVAPKLFVQEEHDDLNRRFDDIRTSINRGEIEEFTISEDELNVGLSAWVEKEGEDAPRVVAKLKGSDVLGQASIPFTMKDGSKKWLNCEFIVDAAITDGQLSLRTKELKVKDKTFTDKGLMAKPIEELKQYALQKSNRDPEAQKNMRNIESLTVKDGKIHVKVKPGTKLDALPLQK